MSLSRPSARVSLGGQEYSAAEAGLVRVRICMGLSGGHDLAELTLWPSSRLKDAAAGDEMSVSLGEVDSEEAVWTGEVTEVLAGADALVLEGLAATVAISRARKSQTYVSQSVADIVKDLASDMDVDEVQGDLQLDAYSVDDRRSVWSHVLDLAALTGADVGCSAEGGLRFVPYESGSADVSLRYGAHVLSWHAGPAPAPAVPVVAASGAASDAGAEKWHWLTRDPAGGSSPARVVAAFRTKDAADQLNQVLADRAARAAVRGHLTVVGRHDVRPGMRVEVEDLPSGDLGTLRVLAVEHVLDARSGFTTALTVESAGGGGSGGLP